MTAPMSRWLHPRCVLVTNKQTLTKCTKCTKRTKCAKGHASAPHARESAPQAPLSGSAVCFADPVPARATQEGARVHKAAGAPEHVAAGEAH
eukprot:411664-Pyramimonas_sp.AAC.2